MMREAESHADEDKKRREDIEARNRADQAVYTAERMLRDTGDKLPAQDRAAIEAGIGDLKKAIDSNETAAIQRAMDALTAVQHKAAESLYRQQQQGGAAPGGASDAGAEGAGTGKTGQTGGTTSDVIDAEVVDEDKK
jgi:molecular chaperone DnaK